MNLSTENKEVTLSPMMQQWKTLKDQAPHALLLFRLGDFYEAFYDDAKILSEALDVVLTHRQSIPMSGVPHHQLENYLDKLIEKQLVIAVAEQVESNDAGKGLVKREITEIISPATNLNGKRNLTNYYFGTICNTNTAFGLAFLELSIGEFVSLEVDDVKSVVDEMSKRRPVEILVSPKFQKKYASLLNDLKNIFSFRLTISHESRFEPSLAESALSEHFGAHSFDGIGLTNHPAAKIACGGMIKYLKTDLCRNLSHIQKVDLLTSFKFLKLDHATLNHLEILETRRDRLSLQKSIDFTSTAMGRRTLEFFLTHPLIDLNEINQRQDAVESLLKNQNYKKLFELLYPIKDLQRLSKRADLDILLPKEASVLKTALISATYLKTELEKLSLIHHFKNVQQLDLLRDLVKLLDESLMDPPPQKIGQGKLLKFGHSTVLDDLYSFKSNSETYLENYQFRLKEESGIKTLKVGYNRAFGYFIEISKGQASSAPQNFERLQTLVNAERFVTQELKDYEIKVSSCESQILAHEEQEFKKLKDSIRNFSKTIDILAQELGYLDVMISFAKLADENEYTRPTVDNSLDLEIQDGKHPVLALRSQGEKFIPNDTQFLNDTKLKLITGPNMAGKSTYIRQNALLVLMAQMGSFVPAKKMRLGWVDQIFSRVGASDDLNRGLSTFMVEMIETSNILHHAKDRSLIILDEIGRGTSTYDGIAIASSVAEYLVSKKKNSPKTLFATHYFELTELEQQFPEIKNFHVEIQEKGDEVIFLRKILKGVLDKSFGIHVAKLAGIPVVVLDRAKTLLKELETTKNKKQPKKHSEQYSLFDMNKDIKAELLKKKILELDVDSLSPKEALSTLYKLKEDMSN